MKARRVTLMLLGALLSVFSCSRDEIEQTETPGETPPIVNPADEDDADDVNWSKTVAYVFDSQVIPEIHVRVSQEEWNRLLDLFDHNRNTQEHVHCDVDFIKGGETITVADAGLRLKGNTSRRRPQEGDQYRHCHFGLDFHYYYPTEEHTIKGLRKMDLKWFKDDPMYVREIYCYDLFRREGVWTAIRDIYCRLWIKVGDGREIYYGVYGMMEHIDKNYLRIREKEFGSHDGNLWKCHFQSSLKKGEGNIGVDDNKNDYSYELKTNKESGFDAAKAQLEGFIDKLNSLTGTEFDNWISSVMDVELFLKTYAVNVAVGMWDDYWNNSNNYYLYFNSTDPQKYKVWLIPYDYDNTLGTASYCGVQSDSGRQDPLQWGHKSYPLMTKILQNATWKAYYIKCLKEIAAGSFNVENSIPRIQAWHNMISAYVNNDTGQDTKIEDQPANWGSHGEYRLLERGSNNFFEVKTATINSITN